MAASFFSLICNFHLNCLWTSLCQSFLFSYCVYSLSPTHHTVSFIGNNQRHLLCCQCTQIYCAFLTIFYKDHDYLRVSEILFLSIHRPIRGDRYPLIYRGFHSTSLKLLAVFLFCYFFRHYALTVLSFVTEGNKCYRL